MVSFKKQVKASSSWQAISELRGVTRSGVTQFYLQSNIGEYTPP